MRYRLEFGGLLLLALLSPEKGLLKNEIEQWTMAEVA
jgi:hypothetical protein